MQKNQFIDRQKILQRSVNTSQVFSFNSAKYDLNSIKSYLLPLLVNEKQIKRYVIKKANQFISFKFGNKQFLDIMNFLGGATSLDSFLRAYKTIKTKGFFPNEGLIVEIFEKTKRWQLCKIFSANYATATLSKTFRRITNIYSTQVWHEALRKLNLQEILRTETGNYCYLQEMWRSNNMQTFRDFLW